MALKSVPQALNTILHTSHPRLRWFSSQRTCDGSMDAADGDGEGGLPASTSAECRDSSW